MSTLTDLSDDEDDKVRRTSTSHTIVAALSIASPVAAIMAPPPYSGPPNLGEKDQDRISNSSDEQPDVVAKECKDEPHELVFISLERTTEEKTKTYLPDGWEVKTAPNGQSYFTDHNNHKTTWDDPRVNNSVLRKDYKTVDELGPLPDGWGQRVHDDGRMIFVNYKSRTTSWEDPRIKDLIQSGPKVPYSLEYNEKSEVFKERIKHKYVTSPGSRFEINVRRWKIFEDSYLQIMALNKKEIQTARQRLWIDFEGEYSQDYGGVAREWFSLLAKEVFNPEYGLFEYSANKTLQINPNSEIINAEHLNYFKFIGRLAGMAVFHGKLLDVYFVRPFYKMILNQVVTIEDMKYVDEEYYNSLKYIMKNDPSDLTLNFVVFITVFGKIEAVPLKENGSHTLGKEPQTVNNENKAEYINLIIKFKLVDRIKSQMTAFIDGFNEILPTEQLKEFDANELELLMCGLGDPDITDWMENTRYLGGYGQTHQVIIWFWQVVALMSKESRCILLQFVTGSRRIPMNGFIELWGSKGPQLFTIEKWDMSDDRFKLPRAHTCFNRLDLPPYTSFEELREKLFMAMENSEGFEEIQYPF